MDHQPPNYDIWRDYMQRFISELPADEQQLWMWHGILLYRRESPDSIYFRPALVSGGFGAPISLQELPPVEALPPQAAHQQGRVVRDRACAVRPVPQWSGPSREAVRDHYLANYETLVPGKEFQLDGCAFKVSRNRRSILRGNQTYGSRLAWEAYVTVQRPEAQSSNEASLPSRERIVAQMRDHPVAPNGEFWVDYRRLLLGPDGSTVYSKTRNGWKPYIDLHSE